MKVFLLSTLFLALSFASAQIPDGYKVVTVPLPRGAVSVLGLCHKPDGTLAIATWEGDIWERKGEVWTKFAEDLMEPNGILWMTRNRLTISDKNRNLPDWSTPTRMVSATATKP